MDMTDEQKEDSMEGLYMTNGTGYQRWVRVIILRAFCKHSIRRRIRRRINEDLASFTILYSILRLSPSRRALLIQNDTSHAITA